ncbi:hypothetical protein LMG27952_02624 [Paraburkholderia hiiakae]|uniref:Uncharacterized protein n=1 Tax=Paraburkholderia hiiakae TaxID=1081782 RepID=A0ABN7HT82_9BURK|nr:hypothetical protein [Paraburkholderia hiiakae]CAD6531810.1 hypothetical protein LMG27952_02624 [Paraburkholderia hiiakae]
MQAAPTARQWDQARLRIKNFIEGPNSDIDRMITAVLETGALTPALKAEFPPLASNELAQRVEAAVRAAIPLREHHGTSGTGKGSRIEGPS